MKSQNDIKIKQLIEVVRKQVVPKREIRWASLIAQGKNVSISWAAPICDLAHLIWMRKVRRSWACFGEPNSPTRKAFADAFFGPLPTEDDEKEPTE